MENNTNKTKNGFWKISYIQRHDSHSARRRLLQENVDLAFTLYGEKGFRLLKTHLQRLDAHDDVYN